MKARLMLGGVLASEKTLLVLCVIWQFGCGGGNPPAPPPPQAAEFVYVANQASPNQGTNSISAFELDTAGHLRELPQSPVPLPLLPYNLIADPKSRFLLVGGPTSLAPGAPSVYIPAAIGASHDLTLVSNSQLPFGFNVMDPQGSFFFDADNGFTTNTPVHVYNAGGDLSFLEIASSPFFAGILPAAIDPAGKFIYGIDLFGGGGSTIDTLQIASTGALSKISSVSASLFAQFAYVHPSGQFLYVQSLDPSSNVDLQVYKINHAGSLTPAALEQNIVPGKSLRLTAFSPSGKFVLALECSNTCEVDTLTIDTVTGTINPTPTHSFPNTGAFAIDSTGSRVFQLSSGPDCSVPGLLTVLGLDGNGRTRPTGITLPTGTCPDAVVVMH
jgi:DNA-binding beta-propeller fold protein YncE